MVREDLIAAFRGPVPLRSRLQTTAVALAFAVTALLALPVAAFADATAVLCFCAAVALSLVPGGLAAGTGCFLVACLVSAPPVMLMAHVADGVPGMVALLLAAAAVGLCARNVWIAAARHRVLADCDLIGLVDLKDQSVAWASPGFESLLGWGAGELAGKPVRAVCPDEASLRAFRLRADAAKRARAALRTEMDLLRKDGGRVRVEVRGKWLDRWSDRVLWVVRDIAERSAERAVALSIRAGSGDARSQPAGRGCEFCRPAGAWPSSSARDGNVVTGLMEALMSGAAGWPANGSHAFSGAQALGALESIGDGVITTNMKGQVEWLNLAAERFTGWANRDASGHRLGEVFPLIDAATWLLPGPGNHNAVLVSRSGAEFGIEQSSAPIVDERQNLLGMVVVFRDVSEQRRLDRAAREREQDYAEALARLDVLFVNSPDAMVIARRAESGTFVYEAVNPIWERLAGVAAGQAAGRSPEACLPGSMAASVGAAWADCVRDRRAVAYGFRSGPDGGRDWEALAVPVVDQGGEIGRLIDVARDVTKRNMLEASVRQMQRMEAVGQLTAGVAHDFNNLLQAILGALEMLRETTALDLEALEYATIAESAAQRGATLVHRLLAFSRKQPLDPVVLRPGAIYTDLGPLLVTTLGSRIRVESRVESGAWPVRADGTQLENCLLNLALNARDAMPDGGVLWLRAENAGAEAAVAEGLPAGEYVRFTVADTGTGMAPETLARALEPFFTTKPIGKGTGLGLSMVQGFARQSGGDVRIVSALGQGTRVSMWLPRATGDDVSGAGGRAAGGGAEPERPCVLVVDDEPSICRMLSLSLGKAGFRTVVRESGDLALSYLRGGGACDLLVSDQSMPGMTGSELILEAEALRPELPSLLITGHDMVSGLDRVRGRVTVLRKPFRQAMFLEQVRTLVSGPVRGGAALDAKVA